MRSEEPTARVVDDVETQSSSTDDDTPHKRKPPVARGFAGQAKDQPVNTTIPLPRCLHECMQPRSCDSRLLRADAPGAPRSGGSMLPGGDR